MTFQVDVITLFPELFPGPLGASVCGRALKDGIWSLEVANLRDCGIGRHRRVDDAPAGGGPGMVLRPDAVARALDRHAPDRRPRLYLSARGDRLDQSLARQLGREPGLVLLCGRFEGLDQRVIEARGLREISIGDFVLCGGEVAAMALIEACVRLLPGSLGNPASTTEESHADGRLEYPQYTKPGLFEGRRVPEVLRSGDHRAIAEWRRARSEALTRLRRPDLLSRE